MLGSAESTKVSVIVRLRNDNDLDYATHIQHLPSSPLSSGTAIYTPQTSPQRSQFALPTQYCLVPNQQENSIHYFNPHTSHSASYLFDHVLQGHDNQHLYQVAAKDLIWNSLMEGIHCTILAYGQTASGKTYSMMGIEEQPGILPQSINDVFEYIREQSQDKEYLLRVSYLEIYNETIRDLLCPSTMDLRILQDKKKGTYVSPLKEEIVTSPKQVMKIIQKGERNRHYGTTEYNIKSSRSHTVFQMVIECRSTGSTTKTKGKTQDINLIDLAGSEKAVVDLERRKEGAFINKSLLTLGNVISKLADESSSSVHVPYRDSKLTRLLQTSLSGNSRISVVCTLNPCPQSAHETLSTLKFATRLKTITLKPTTNIHYDDKTLLQLYKLEIEDLRTRLAHMETLLTENKYHKEEDVELLKAEKKEIEQKLQDEHLVRVQLKERIDHLTKLILTSSSITPKTILDWNAPSVHIDQTTGAKRASVILEGLLPSCTPEPGSPGRRQFGSIRNSTSPRHRSPLSSPQSLQPETRVKQDQEFYRRHIQEIDARDEKIKSLKTLVHTIRRTCQQQARYKRQEGPIYYELLWKELMNDIETHIQSFENNNETMQDPIENLQEQLEQMKTERQELEIVVKEQQEQIVHLESVLRSHTHSDLLEASESRRSHLQHLKEAHQELHESIAKTTMDTPIALSRQTSHSSHSSTSTCSHPGLPTSPPPAIPLPPIPDTVHPATARSRDHSLVKQFYDLFGHSGR